MTIGKDQETQEEREEIMRTETRGGYRRTDPQVPRKTRAIIRIK
jgi:hypothetical protein